MKNKKWFFIILAVIGAALLLLAGCSTGQKATEQTGVISDDQVNAVARDLFCPVCEGIPLDVCDTQACADWREQIRTMLGEGMTKLEIQEYFSAQFGVRVLPVPPDPWVYIIPGVLVLLATGVVTWVLLQGRKPAAENMKIPGAPTDDDPYIARMEEELKKRMGGKK